MNVLLDQNVPLPLIKFLAKHNVRTAAQQGWHRLTNGNLLAAARGFFDVLITCDQNIIHQKNPSGRNLAVVAVNTNIWPVIRNDPAKITQAVDAATFASYANVDYPKPVNRRRAYKPTP